MKRFIILIMLIPSIIVIRTAAQTSQYVYAYVTVSDDNVVLIYTVDISGVIKEADNFIIPYEDVWLDDAFSSPDGQWITFIFNTRTKRYVSVFDVSTGDLNNISYAMAHEFDNADERQQDIAWSPDSQYLAFNALQGESLEFELDTMLYSPVDSSIINLTDDLPDQYHLAWSDDSTMLAVLQEENHISTPTKQITIELFDVSTLSHVNTMPIWEPNSTWTYGFTTSCNLGWSPDNQFLHFSMGCDRTHVDEGREVYIADIVQGNVSRITDYTISLTQLDSELLVIARVAFYSLYWGDAHTLLIGAEFPNEVDHRLDERTTAYNITTNTETEISSNRITDWVGNPASNRIAFYMGGTTNIGEFNGQDMNIINSIPHTGTRLSWSPNGEMLALISFWDGSISFMDESTWLHYPIIMKTKENIQDIGWIVDTK